jgi:hypothetical protein
MRRLRAGKDFEIVVHGVDHCQYFQGCGVVFTSFADVATGAGDNAKEAYDDAVESLATAGYDVSGLPTHPRGIRATDAVRHVTVAEGPGADEANDSEIYYYVSIRVAANFPREGR